MTETRTPYKTDTIRDLRPGLKKAILRALEHAKGIDNAISQTKLLDACKVAVKQEKLDNRKLRDTINELRNEGWLICSLSGRTKGKNSLYAALGIQSTDTENSGYYLPATLEEYRRYRSFHMSYARNIFETLRVMDKSAEKEFAFDMGFQPGLFGDLPKESELM